MKKARRPTLIIATISLLGLTSCERDASTRSADANAANPWDDLPELRIDLPAKSDPEISADNYTPPEPDENGMITISIGVPPTFLYRGSNATARDILERAGVSFPEGADARYDPITGLLNVHNTPDQIELVEAFTMSIGSGPEQEIACRFEVFEMPAAFARELVEKADRTARHQGIRDQALEACRKGRAEFVTTVDLPCRSGQRAGTETGITTLTPALKGIPEPAEAEKEEKEKEKPTQLLDWKQSGLEVEVDPVVGADGITIDLNIAFRQAIHPDKDSTGLPSTELTTSFSVIDQTTQLIGVFPAQETSSSESENRQRLVFIQATVRFLE
jgi:hypothetical protein